MITNAGCFSLFLVKITFCFVFGEKLNLILLTITFIVVYTRNIGKSKVSQSKDFHCSKFDWYAYDTFGDCDLLSSKFYSKKS